MTDTISFEKCGCARLLDGVKDNLESTTPPVLDDHARLEHHGGRRLSPFHEEAAMPHDFSEEAMALSAGSGGPSGPPLPPPEIPDHKMLRRIGRGSYGDVWLARNVVGTYRAVKVVYRKSFERDRPYDREFAGIQKFEPISRSHEGLVDILQIGRNEEAGYFYYVMELADDVSGESGVRNAASDAGAPSSIPHSALRDPQSYVPTTLRSLLQPNSQPSSIDAQQTTTHLPLAQCLEIGLALTSALVHLHKHGLVHRDIKPSNIIFVDGAPKLADIGLVTDMSEARSYVGTEGFIPPEGPGTSQADLYSLGKVLYEISTGKDRHDFPELPPAMKESAERAGLSELNEVILKACAGEVRERYQSAEEMQADLAHLQCGQSVRRKRSAAKRLTLAKKIVLVTVALALTLTALPMLKGSKPGHTPNPEAVAEYDQGQYFYHRLTSEAATNALYHLHRAAQLDPKFVQPYGELTALYVWCIPPGISNDQVRLRRTKEIADQALAIDPDSAEGHAALSLCKFLERDWRSAEAEILRALHRNPNFAIAHDMYAFFLSMQGRIDEAKREAQHSQRIAPTARTTAVVAAWPFIAARQLDQAIAQLQRAIKLDENFVVTHGYLGMCYEAQSNYLAAIEEFEIADLLSVGRNSPLVPRVKACYSQLRQAYSTLGEQGYLRKWVELLRADEALPDSEKMFDVADRNLDGYYARLGEHALALDVLEQHFDEVNVWQQVNFLPCYDSLHDEPRFKALVRRAGLEK